MSTIHLHNKTIGAGAPCFVITEVACAHDGSLERAKMFVDAAAAAQTDAVQFIAFTTEGTTAPYFPGFEKGKELEFTEKEWKDLIAYAKAKGLIVSAAVQDLQSAQLMKECDLDIYKIHSPDLSNPELIAYAAGLGKPLILTVGAATFKEVEAAIKVAQEAGNKDIILMYGFQNFPTKVEQINLRLLETLKETFSCTIGYADHTDGDSPLTMILPILSTHLGAVVLEKHITHDRAEKGTDHESALNPEELKQFVSLLRDVENAIGDGKRKPFTEAEQRYRDLTKKSIVAAREITRNEIIQKKDLLYLRSKPGIPPNEAQKIIGKTCKKDILQCEVILEEDVQ